ncbi:MAG: hypothetical protein NXI00_20065 [Cytophagales bacterium]|nr:hypothetical protein [Cytophagales bacterium]
MTLLTNNEVDKDQFITAKCLVSNGAYSTATSARQALWKTRKYHGIRPHGLVTFGQFMEWRNGKKEKQ